MVLPVFLPAQLLARTTRVRPARGVPGPAPIDGALL